MSSPAPPSVPKKNSENVKVPSEQILQNLLDRLPLPSNALERTYEIKDELVSVEKQCTPSPLSSLSVSLLLTLSCALSLCVLCSVVLSSLDLSPPILLSASCS
jgi:hypothetical protein